MVEHEYAKALTELVLRTDDPLQEEKIDALRKIIGRANAYRKEGFLEEIIKSAKPYYDGNELDGSNYIFDICSVYREIIKDLQGIYHLIGEQRTGCIYSGFGVTNEKELNRYQRLQMSY